MDQPFVSIYWNRKRDEYSVQPFTRGPVAWTAFGEPTVLQKATFQSGIYDAVVANLSKFGKQEYRREHAARLSADERNAFLDANLEVSVEQKGFNELIVRPLQRERGGRVGFDEEAIVVKMKEAPSKLATAILEAFNKSS